MTQSALAYTPEVEQETAPIREKMGPVLDERRWERSAPYIAAINKLKKEKNAVILAHNYQVPEIFFGVADITGDSLKLAQEAAKSDADIILQAGVYFMAETSKILNPDKTVLIPSLEAGCSLASSITAADVRLLREKYPGVPVVSYVNTTAEVKAETDVCCTSSNAVQIVNALGVDKVIFLPDEYLAKYVASKTDVQIISWKGHCEVHERFSAEYIRELRAEHPGLTVLGHPECDEDVLAECDYVGSTAQMADYVEQKQPPRLVLITECSMSDNVYAANPNLEFIRPCQLCPHMKTMSLQNILESLQNMTHEVLIDPAVSKAALGSIERMLELSK
ncbi:MAG: quinolinate synthase NadA [Rhodospirillales bacterium]|nr:quinolinate synthase NadA [Rhodospirillales bacterium]MCB9996219.1 quinolinate synthase NadA [Rhodospirillales bacterium]